MVVVFQVATYAQVTPKNSPMGQSFSAEPVVEKHTETDRNWAFDAAVSSCQGWRFSQEDDHSLKLELPGEHKASFFAVFDGHGSAKVSKHAAESLWRHITQNQSYIQGNFKEALEQSFLTFDREVFESYNAQLAGTTATCVLIVDNVIYCANIGDSRSVASVKCECVPLSHDHKPENPLELKRILSAGGYVLGNRVNGNLALSRAFGDFHYKTNEQLPADQQIVSPFPEVSRIELNDDVDFIVLACDGIWDVLTSEDVVEFVISRLEREVRPDQICEQLTTRCLATDYELVIGCDNMTVLLVCYTNGKSWSEYCTDIFNKNTKKLGVPNRPRILDSTYGNDSTTFQHPNQRFEDTSQNSEQLSASATSDQSGKSPPKPTPEELQEACLKAGRRGVDELFYLLQTGRTYDQPERSSGIPPTDEIPAEEDLKIHDASAESVVPSKAAEVDVGSQQNQAETTENEEPDKISGEARDGASKTDLEVARPNDDENLISSGTAEINLNDAEVSDDTLLDANEIEPIELNYTQADEQETEGDSKEEVQHLAEGTVEVELSAPDDGPINEVSQAAESNEIDEGITVEEPKEEEETNSSAPNEEEPMAACPDDTTTTTKGDDDDAIENTIEDS